MGHCPSMIFLHKIRKNWQCELKERMDPHGGNINQIQQTFKKLIVSNISSGFIAIAFQPDLLVEHFNCLPFHSSIDKKRYQLSLGVKALTI